MVIIGRAARLWDLITAAQPALRERFERIRAGIGTPAEREVVHDAYRDVASSSLSGDVFERVPSSLGVLSPRSVLERLEA